MISNITISFILNNYNILERRVAATFQLIIYSHLFLSGIPKNGITDLGLPDHHLKYFVRKYPHKEMFSRSLGTLDQVVFPNYKNFNHVKQVYRNFIGNLKTKFVKSTNPQLLDEEILEIILSRDKLFKSFNRSQPHSDREIYNKVHNTIHKLIS